MTCMTLSVTVGATMREAGMIIMAFEGMIDGEHTNVMLTLDEHPDDQCIALGLTGPHLEWNDEARSGYGLIASIAWKGADLEIVTNEDAQALGIPSCIVLSRAAHVLDCDEQTLADEMTTTIRNALNQDVS